MRGVAARKALVVEYDSAMLVDLVRHIPAVIVFWFLMVRPHMQKIEMFMARVAESSEESSETLKRIRTEIGSLDARVTLIEQRIDDTPALGVRNPIRKDGQS